MSLFDTQDLAEITHPDYPGERLIACRNPALAEKRTYKRKTLLTATESSSTTSPPGSRPAPSPARTPSGAVGKVVDKYNVAKHLIDITHRLT